MTKWSSPGDNHTTPVAGRVVPPRHRASADYMAGYYRYSPNFTIVVGYYIASRYGYWLAGAEWRGCVNYWLGASGLTVLGNAIWRRTGLSGRCAVFIVRSNRLVDCRGRCRVL